MKTLTRWIIRAGVAVVLLIMVAVATVYGLTSSKMNRLWDVPLPTLEIPDDSATVAWGRHLIESRGCTDCHGEDLGGQVFIDGGPVGVLTASNLTSGEGGVAHNYTNDAYWVRAIRHGVRADGAGLIFMPSYEYYFYSDRDVAALVAYLKTIPPVDRVNPAPRVGPLGRVLYLAGQFPLLPVEMIDHTAPRDEPEPGPTVEYGRYLAVGCTGCHSPNFGGGKIPGVPPDWPWAANLTEDSPTGVQSWSEEEFKTALRTGRRPGGAAPMEAPYMPINAFRNLNDDELTALYLFVQTLEPVEEGAW